MSSNGFLNISPHTMRKYSILQKYLKVCAIFDKHYSNCVYVDTHGGSGKVLLNGKYVNGSPLIAANWHPSFPCHIVEIDPDTYSCLCASMSGCNNVQTYNDDCNKIISNILSTIPRGQKFVFFFVDPSALVYYGKKGDCDQLTADTIRSISEFPRSELLLNFPLESILRCAGDYFSNPSTARAIANGCRVTTFMGSKSWQGLAKTGLGRREFLEIYMDEMLSEYPFKGAMLIRSVEKNLPLYYLVYATRNYTAAKIMRDIMKKEGNYPIYAELTTGRRPTIDEVYPIRKFIFDQ
jgi:three-Cys-motif partner protein